MIMLNPSPVAALSDELVDLADVVDANSAEDAALATARADDGWRTRAYVELHHQRTAPT
jgi:hypothetical protein